MSIRPKHAEAILDGRKTTELRKRLLADDINVVLLYATKPVGMIVGAFHIDFQHSGPLTRVMEMHVRRAAVTRDEFRRYYLGHARHRARGQQAYAIGIRDTHRFPTPIPLDYIRPGLRAPQSWLYLVGEELAPLYIGAPPDWLTDALWGET